MEEVLLNYGLAGVGLISLGWFILYLLKSHRTERKEFREMFERMSEKMDNRQDDTNKAMRENTGILQGLKTLLENRNK